MPCWYFEKKEIRNTPSIQDGLDHATEARYRREGARFIIDAGTKMGLYPCSYNLDSLNIYIILLNYCSLYKLCQMFDLACPFRQL